MSKLPGGMPWVAARIAVEFQRLFLGVDVGRHEPREPEHTGSSETTRQGSSVAAKNTWDWERAARTRRGVNCEWNTTGTLSGTS